jgi:hypothetical protein
MIKISLKDRHVNKRILIVGLRIRELTGDPQKTLLGNPMRSWALYTGLAKYGFDTKLFIGAGCNVDEANLHEHGDKLIRDSNTFLSETKDDNTIVVVCGTRIHETIAQHPWIANVEQSQVILAQCYHNVLDPLPTNFLSKIKHAFFVTPKYVHSWNEQYPNIPSSIVTTGQVESKPDAHDANGDAIFVGHIHQSHFLNLMAKLADNNTDKTFHIVSTRIRKKNSRDYAIFIDLSEQERNKLFKELVENIYDSECPTNLIYHFLPPGEEELLMSKVSIGIDYTWNPKWVLDNSKVPYYLTYGLNVIAHLPAPSHRFVTKFNAGVKIKQGAHINEWNSAVKELSTLTLEDKNQRRVEAGQFFSWDNVVFDVASVLLEISES